VPGGFTGQGDGTMTDPWIFWLLFVAVGLVMIGAEVAGRLAERQLRAAIVAADEENSERPRPSVSQLGVLECADLYEELPRGYGQKDYTGKQSQVRSIQRALFCPKLASVTEKP